MPYAKPNLTNLIKKKAKEAGFSDCGITRPHIPTEDKLVYREWLQREMEGEMGYLQRNVEKREDPTLLVPNTKSVVVLLLSYRHIKTIPPRAKFLAFAPDYHPVIKEKLFDILSYLQGIDSTIQGRCFVDSAPVLERSLAVQAGIGGVGKNSCLISPKWGSYCFISELFLNVELVYDKPFEEDLCGTCERCLKACPTQTILPNRTINAKHCLAYLTWERPRLRKRPPPAKMQGCDICQEVCPYNKKLFDVAN